MAPEYLSSMITLHHPNRALRSAENLTLVMPWVKSATYGERQFKNLAAKLWNALPLNIRQARTLYTFKKHLKHHLFVQEFGL
jgi:cell division inhibitor SulA